VETRSKNERYVNRLCDISDIDIIYLLSEIHLDPQPNIQSLSIGPSESSQIFTGRKDYLEKLKQYFGPGIDSRQRRRQFLLYGMGGVGKTQICLRFVEEVSDW
jgi:hypothetical protein